MLRSDASVAAFAACVGFACYLNSFICGFVFDDRLAIIDNADVQLSEELMQLIGTDSLSELFDMLDCDRSGEVDIDECPFLLQ